MPANSAYTTVDYLLEDYPRTLFPLTTTRTLASLVPDLLHAHVQQVLTLTDGKPTAFFLTQQPCYASKRGFHLRRTVKLDPVAEFFIYDFVFRHRGHFRKRKSTKRESYGYVFATGRPVSPSSSYGEFRSRVLELSNSYKHSFRFDISSYFNSVYHHDVEHWFEEFTAVDQAAQLGRFLREANHGRSLDCLPQGIHPCKVIGSHFLRFVDEAASLRSASVVRFMDDFFIFDNSTDVLRHDFIAIQQLLGSRGLSLNADKTAEDDVAEHVSREDIDNVKIELLQMRRELIEVSGEEIEISDDDDESEPLTSGQLEFLLDLLKNPDIDEADAELVLTVLRDRGADDDVFERLTDFLKRFPSLSRTIYNFCGYVEESSEVAALLANFLGSAKTVTEDQLFWIAKIAEDFLKKTPKYSEILTRLYEHPSATSISKAKLLEIPEQRFGVPDWREEYLTGGRSDWLAWASAMGSAKVAKSKRNHLLGYFANASAMNRLIADCVRGI